MSDETPQEAGANAALSEAELQARLEAFRQSGIRIDSQGRFWHQGAIVEHEGLRQALWRWLDRLPPPDGRTILRLDEKRYVYVEVEDTPLVAHTLRWTAPHIAPLLSLSDGREEPLDPAQLTLDGAGTLRTWVRNGKLEARLASAAATVLAEHITMNGERATLKLPGQAPADIKARG